VTLPLKPRLGRAVKIELLGASASHDAFNVNELQNQQNAATGDARQSGGTLAIVEAEFYELPNRVRPGAERH
jgi:hypothetical protein